jgi:hypothetical protein
LTAQEIFDLTMCLIDELKNDGTVNTATTLMYSIKAPIFLNIGQMEIIKDTEITKTFDTVFTNVSDDWTLITMPSDFKNLDQIISIENDINISIIGSYRWEKPNLLYIHPDFIGTVRVVYKPIPTQITSLSDDLTLDNMDAVTMLTHYLASYLLLEENPTLSNYFLQRYQEMKGGIKLNSKAFMPIQDMYGYCDG